MKKIVSILFLSALMLPGVSLAQSLSSIPAAFLDVGFGTRPVAMGNAFVGLADDINSVYLNPAGLTSLTGKQVQFTHTQLMGLVDYNFLAAGLPLPGNQAAGIALISSGDQIMREFSLHMAYARHVGPVSAGAALKVRYASFGNNTLNPDDFAGIFDPSEIDIGIRNQVYGDGTGIGLDLGVIYDASEDLRFGIFLRDIYAPFFWDSQTDNPDSGVKGSYNERIPFEMAIGSSYRVSDHTRFSFEYRPTFDEEQDHAVRVGVERIFLNVLALRAGTEQWINNMDDDKYMLGVGIITPEISGISANFNYTYVIDELANTHRIGFQIHF